MGKVCNPLSIITGEICPHYKICKKPCVLARERTTPPHCVGHPSIKEGNFSVNNKSALVVGAGPAGLASAWILGRRGYKVTVVEREKQVGGALRLIPEDRLDKSHIDKVYKDLCDAGVKFRLGIRADLAEKFDLVVVATGTWASRRIGIDGENLPNVVDALEYLESPRMGVDKVIIIGGGNVAMDAALLACKYSKDVTVCYRRGERDMKAGTLEIEMVKKAGINFQFNAVPASIDKRGVHFTRNFEDLYFKGGLVITAIGQVAELPKGIEKLSNVIIVGDAALGATSIVQAVQDAKLKCMTQLP